MVLMKNWQFLLLFILGKKGQHNVFQDILERKKRLSTLKKQQVKRSRKIGIFRKGIVSGLGQKKATVPIFLFLVKLARKMCFMIFYKEKPPLKI